MLFCMRDDLFLCHKKRFGKPVQHLDVDEIAYHFIGLFLAPEINFSGKLVDCFELSIINKISIDYPVFSCPHSKLYVTFVAYLAGSNHSALCFEGYEVREPQSFFDGKFQRCRFQCLHYQLLGLALLKVLIPVIQVNDRGDECTAVLLQGILKLFLNGKSFQYVLKRLNRPLWLLWHVVFWFHGF